jgi:hypothetical protein
MRPRMECLVRGRNREPYHHDAMGPRRVLLPPAQEQAIRVQHDFKATTAEIGEALANVFPKTWPAEPKEDP